MELPRTLDELLVGIDKSELYRQCSDVDLARLAGQLVSWQTYAPFLGTSAAEEREIKQNHPFDYLLQKRDMLLRWKARNPDNATYIQLMRVFFNLKELDTIEAMKEILLNPVEVPLGQDPILVEYQSFLMNSYQLEPHPGMLPNQTPPMKFPVYVNLTMDYSKSSPAVSIKLQELFQKTKPQKSDAKIAHTIVIKGLPGSGKSTLTWYASQQWAMKKLFQEAFLLFISIPLRSQRIQRATQLADLIPHPDRRHRKAIAQALATKQGKGTCFWFDGWDEMPEAVKTHSFIGSFIKRDRAGDFLPLCSIAVTTRPTDSLTATDSPEVVINNFTTDQMEQYITHNLKDHPENKQRLITKIKEDEILHDFCSLPINLAIMVHLFYSFSMSLPKTASKLFKCLILNLLLRNLQTRWTGHHIKALKSFKKLPSDALRCFRNLCNTAFQGVMTSKTTFTEDEVQHTDLSLDLCTLSLMKITTKSEWFGLEHEISFLHYSVQEFLAAVHIAMIESDDEKVELVQKLAAMEGQKPVIRFYAGITKLRNKKVQEMLMQVCKEPLCYYGWFAEKEKKRFDSLLLLVAGIYETQSHVLCQLAFKMLLAPKVMVRSTRDLHDTSIFYSKNQFQLDYFFAKTNLSSMDLRALGYFIGNCCIDHICRVRIIDFRMFHREFANFVNEIVSIHRQSRQPSLSLTIDAFKYDTIHHEGVEILCGLIRDMHILSSLSLTPDLSALQASGSMRNIVEAFSRNTSCSMLHLNFNFMCILPGLESFSDQLQIHYYLILLLTFCRGIRELGLHQLYVEESFGTMGINLIAAALKYNQHLVFLDLTDSMRFSDRDLLFIAEALQSNHTLLALAVGDSLNEQQLTKFLNWIVDSPLSVLVTSVKINEEHKAATRRLIKFRTHNQYLRQKKRPIFYIVDSVEKASLYLKYVAEHGFLQL